LTSKACLPKTDRSAGSKDAGIDGANKWRRAWHVSLPGIHNTMLLLFILSISSLMSDSLEQVFVTKNPAVYDAAEIIPTFVYTKGLTQMNTSCGVAIGL
jgi:putative aldouronate transport system permease protein